MTNRNIAFGICVAIAALFGFAIILGSWYTVDQTERGVRLRYGAVIGTAQPGLGFKIPLIDSVEKVSVKTVTYTWDKMNSYSYDQQPADLKISVTLRASPDKVADLYASSAGWTPRSTRSSARSSTSRSRSCSAATRR